MSVDGRILVSRFILAFVAVWASGAATKANGQSQP